MKTQERPLPVVRCADEYFMTFGNPWEGKMLKGLALGIGLMFAVDVLVALLARADLEWLVVIPLLGGSMTYTGLYYFKPHPRDGEGTGPRVSRAKFFRTAACLHCGKPAGSIYLDRWIIHLDCVHCGGEAKTDCRILKLGGPPMKVWSVE